MPVSSYGILLTEAADMFSPNYRPLSFVQLDARQWQVYSDRNIYTLQLLKGGDLTCNCPAFKQSHSCIHTERLVDYLRASINHRIAPYHTYTDDWDELQAQPVEYLIVDRDAPGYAVAQPLADHFKDLFRLGYQDDNDEDEDD